MNLNQELLAVKLYELEKQYGKLLSRIRICGQEDREKLFQVVEFLLAHETMSGAQFKACMEGRDMDAAGPGSLFDPI